MNSGMIPRNRLFELMEELSEERMVYISAPAGYGKTVSVRQWLERTKGRSIIMTLDEYDNDPAHFCVWFCAALRDCQPANAELGDIISQPAFSSAPALYATRAVAALTDGDSVRFVVDDLHFVHNGEVLRLLLSFMKRLPKNFKIVIISRIELPDGFSELLVKGQLASITAKQLLFSGEEIALLYKKNGVSITPTRAEDILRFTGGWAIGISAVLLSGGELEGEGIKYLEEYIKSHVWPRWALETREFLLKTSVVQEFTPALCIELTGVEDSRRMLDELVLQNAFISQEKGVYRYHPLFHTCLTHMLEERGREYIFKLFSRAGDWYLSQRDFFSAVECFIKSEDKNGLIRCFTFLDLSGREIYIPDKLIPILDKSIISTLADIYPHIYGSLSWASFNKGRVEDFIYYADQYYSHIPEILQIDPRLAYYIIFMWLIDFRITLFDLIQSVGEFQFVNTQSQPNKVRPSLGIINQNMPLLHRGTRDFSECAVGDAEMSVAGVRAALGDLFGEETDLLAESVTAGILYEQGELDKALNHALAANAEIRENFVAETKFCAMAILVNVLDGLGENKRAETELKHIENMIERDKAYYLTYNFNAMLTRRRLLRGDIKAAGCWLETNEPDLHVNPDFYRLYGHFTTCAAYITVGDYDSAIILLTKVLELVTTFNRPLDIITARILLSIAYWKKKRTHQKVAILHLEQAAIIAHNYRYTQLFVIFGAELSGMLQRLQRRLEQNTDKAEPPASFVKQLYLKALEHLKGELTSGQPVKYTKFTTRQRQVMTLLSEGKSYREISEAMGITKPTLRSHIELIYKKLDVTSITDAVLKIKKMEMQDYNIQSE